VQFDVERTTLADRPALTVRGELDIATAPELAAAVETELAAAPSALIIDLTHTVFMDSSGARELVRSARQAAAGGVNLYVLTPQRTGGVRLTIDLLDLGSVVPIVGSIFEITSGVADRRARP
jgi:anti-sigma B factor antagonist